MKRNLSRLILAAATAAAAAGLATSAAAQNVPAKFVVSGQMAQKIQDYTTINLATAENIANTCEGLAAKEGVQVSVYVLDHDGNYVYMDRMDGQGYIQVMTAEMKARTALHGREASKERMNRVIRNPLAEFQQIQLGFFPNSGGLPITVNHQLIGALGVGGSQPRVAEGWSDEICGHKALTAVMGPQPPLLPDLQRKPPANPGHAPVPRFNTPVPKTTLPADDVVSGKAAGMIHTGYEISNVAAKKIANACRQWATDHNGTMSLFILDPEGNFVHAERMDGQIYNNMRTALLKAQTALKLGQPTSQRAARLRNNPGGLPRSIFQFKFYSVSGGLPIIVDGQLIGAIGVGGGAGGGDEACAIHGLQAAFGDHVAVPVYPAAQPG